MADTAPAPKKKGKRTLILAVAVIVLLGGAGGGFWFWRQAGTQAADHSAPEPKGEGAVVSLEPFLVNLADAEASRFLRVTVRLVVNDEDEAKAFEHHAVHQARVRSAVLELLSTQKSGVLVTPEGKAALKRSIAERSSEVLNTQVRDVLFTDFVVQF
jgi:flagellar FliL protein